MGRFWNSRWVGLEVITCVARKMKFLWLPQNHFKRTVSLKHGERNFQRVEQCWKMGSPQTWNPCHFQVINHEIVGGRTIAFDFLGSVMCSNTGICALWNNMLPWKKTQDLWIFPATWNANQLHPATLAGLSTATASTIPTRHGSSARAQWGMGDGCLVEFIGGQRETSKNP